MSKAEQIEKLYEEISRQNTWYMWTVGTMVALIALMLGFFSLYQWRIGDKQIAKMNKETKAAKRSTEMLLNYSLNAIIADNRVGTMNWREKARLYLSFKDIIQEYYPENSTLTRKLKLSKAAVLESSMSTFREIIYNNTNGVDDLDELWDKLEKLYKYKGDVVFSYDRKQLSDFTVNIKNKDDQQSWQRELNTLNTFWDKETLEDD